MSWTLGGGANKTRIGTYPASQPEKDALASVSRSKGIGRDEDDVDSAEPEPNTQRTSSLNRILGLRLFTAGGAIESIDFGVHARLRKLGHSQGKSSIGGRKDHLDFLGITGACRSRR